MTPVPDRAGVLGMRSSAELARIVDLERVLPTASAGLSASRRTGLTDRVALRRDAARALPATEEGWTRLGNDVAQSDVVVDELVALLMTRLLRDSGIDAGAFDAAEALLCELVGRAGVPALVLAHTRDLESIDHTRASVAMRFPGARVWDLPFLAHEFGHHAAAAVAHIEPALAASRPLADTVAALAKDLTAPDVSPARAGAHANELVADAIATVCCGHTYPVACLCLRVPVPGAARASESHPAWTTRIAFCRAVLDALSDEEGRPRYRVMRADVVDPLAVVVLGAAPAAAPPLAAAALRTVRAVRRHRTGLVYRAADDAMDVADWLAARQPVPPRRVDVTAVVDGAWRWRLERRDPGGDDAVAALVARYCRAMTGRET